MAVPSTIADLSVTASSNSPAGTDPIGTTLDDYLRAIQSIIKNENSIGADIASASTITIPNNGHYFVVTGTTGITAINDCWNGRIVFLKFSGIVTLTNSAGLLMPGGVNLTTEAGDSLIMVNESTGVWRCLGSSKDGDFKADGSVPMTGNLQMGANGIVFEGSTADDYETTLNVIDPTADRTINLPNASGTLALTTDIAALSSKVVSFSRDTATASGDQAVTGVGFTPSSIVFIGNEGSLTVSEVTIGFVGSSKAGGGMFKVGDNTGWSYGENPIFVYESSGNTYGGVVKSFDSDGFTITWTKNGSPTGTLNLYALCLR